ncbi:M15 family metallopeptidase [Actinomadura kijaniata]|uniref:M15 family metallopeptidase n=1 Tax=Actinomadura kijaniata TaxID=46161 RepID=UPI001FE0760D|nr:M15 family metallopeptidase [Actinomadura kijaniata]
MITSALLATSLTLAACTDAPAPLDARPSPKEDGRISDARGISPFDTRHPAIRHLDADLLRGVRKAADKARRQGVEMFVTSGWRSVEYQRSLQERAVARYGSREQAERFVLSPEKSAHVRGEAVDIGPTDADDWLIRNGAEFGLCQTYANEMWHFELATRPGGECPPPKSDATAAH